MHQKVSSVQTNIDARIPRFDLKEVHISHLKVLPNRGVLLEKMPKNGIVAELGVNKGEFSEKILEITQPKKFHLVDIWGSERYHLGLRKGIESKFQDLIASDKLVINQGLSTDMVFEFPDSYFDWIYIDTDHSYEVTKAELQSYKNKIKPGGIIAGHDYALGNWGKILRYGVMEAVHEFCVTENWEIIYLTIEMSDNPSFAIRKIQF
jgi:SAM-dependent methyltransferase